MTKLTYFEIKVPSQMKQEGYNKGLSYPIIRKIFQSFCLIITSHRRYGVQLTFLVVLHDTVI